MINPDWLSVCRAYSELKGITEEKAVLLSILIFTNRDIGKIPLPEGYEQFVLLLDGKKPFPGKWVKSADLKKTKGTVRPDNDPTCLTFTEFWTQYGYKTGKPGSAEIWSKLDESKRERIKAHLPQYILKTTTSKAKVAYDEYKPARAMPQSYLNDKDMKYWKGDFDTNVAVIVVPPNAKYKAQYEAHVDKWTTKYPALLGTLLYLGYEDFEKIRESRFIDLGIPNIGPSIRDRNIESAYALAVESGKRVIDNFKKICIDVPI